MNGVFFTFVVVFRCLSHLVDCNAARRRISLSCSLFCPSVACVGNLFWNQYLDPLHKFVSQLQIWINIVLFTDILYNMLSLLACIGIDLFCSFRQYSEALTLQVVRCLVSD